MKDVSALGVERNVFRYVPVPVTIRFDGFLFELVRVLIAAARTGAPVTVSSRVPLPDGLGAQAPHRDPRRLACARRRRATGPRPTRRLRRQGRVACRRAATQMSRSTPDPVTLSGRVEALPFLKEQAISITNHRFGNRDAEFEWVLPRD